MSLRKFYSVKECAEILGIHEQTVRQMILRNELEAVYVGRVIRIPESSIDDLPSVRVHPEGHTLTLRG